MKDWGKFRVKLSRVEKVFVYKILFQFISKAITNLQNLRSRELRS